ncbi:acetolactate synthase large subunit [Pelagivirga sediminicola]|uniref:Acetolactate synthase large subunit n=1 Tax=Pelagivirga sediminicola TaxID=2170575 RepID=A0A2T7G3Y7_9RHOB|nr:acetolactate synthase large subunit [Pelagivirga sediminicola]PVA09117.1 acetolactate synthase large subunit [Pelagivirga sediminicola]
MTDTPKTMNGAESVVRSLHKGGVDVCFANPGTSEMQFVDALDRTKLMHCVLGLFEGVVTGAADGYARMAGKPAVTLLHLAPGFANAAANLHNARKGRVPVLNLVGDHALRHQQYDAPLSADVEAACAPFSDWVKSGTDAGSFAADAMQALAVTKGRPGRVASLIAPADIGWDEGGQMAGAIAPDGPAPLDEDALSAAVAALESGQRTLIIAGNSVLEDTSALAQLRGIADKTGADLLAPTSNRRIERGQGRAALAKIPYPINMALETLAPYARAILIETVPPVAFFAYPGRPSLLLPENCDTVTLCSVDGDGPATIAALADRLGAAPAKVQDRLVPARPQGGAITLKNIGAALANALPEDAIIIDEAVSSGGDTYPAGDAARPNSWLSLTGGSIGIGIPLSAGAAIACPDRPVITIQADGSAMYTIQGLWTQAREGSNVTTIILANRAYEILKGELHNVGAQPGPDALSMLNLDRPHLDFVAMAKGMGVPGRRVEDVAELMQAIEDAAKEPGPYLIEAML